VVDRRLPHRILPRTKEPLAAHAHTLPAGITTTQEAFYLFVWEFIGELLALRQHPQVLPKGKLCRAIDHTLALWDRLTQFVRHGEIEIDNNLIENGIRPTAVGKKNRLFVGGETTGQRAAIIYTLVECAKRHGHNPEAYLADVLERLPALTNQDDLTVLLPANWQAGTATVKPAAMVCPV
jgi:hypothetical protein